MLFVFFISICVVSVFALVPIPLEPQTPCFTHFGECLRYCPGERIPDLEGIESSCITNTAGYQFCKFYHCPPAKCRGKKKDLYGKCYYCPGSCVDGGRKHHNGQAFISFDLVNNCFCGQDNSKHCTKKSVDQYAYCNHARPGSDGDNTVVVVANPRPPPPPSKVVAIVAPPQQQQAPAVMAIVSAPPQQPTTRQMPYVPSPTRPPTPPQRAYVPAPSQPYVPPGSAFANNQESTAYMQQHKHQKMVAHPNFSAKSPKSNLQQRSNNNPNLYRHNQYYQGFPNNQQFYGYHGNPFFQQQMWGFNSNKEIEA